MADTEDPRLAMAKDAADAAAQFKAASDRMRDRADNWGKSLTALGTTVVGYVGIAKFTDMFPVPSGWWWLAVVLTLVLLVVMASMAIAVGWQLSRVSRPVFMRLNPEKSRTCWMRSELKYRRCMTTRPN